MFNSIKFKMRECDIILASLTCSLELNAKSTAKRDSFILAPRTTN